MCGLHGVRHNGSMADDDIERLLSQVSGGEVSRKPDRSPAATDKSAGGRMAFAVVSGVGLGAAAWFVGLILPFTSAVSAGIGGAFAAFVTALVAGPPRWFSS